MVIGTAMGWSNLATIALAVVLASPSLCPDDATAAAGRARLRSALSLAFASDTNLDLNHGGHRQPDHAGDPRRQEASLTSPLFWVSLAAALLIAGAFAFPVNRWLISRGRGTP